MNDLLEDDSENQCRAPACNTCGSELVVKPARLCWNHQSGLWELEDMFSTALCLVCEAKTTLEWHAVNGALPAKRVRELNDRFREHGVGTGTLLITQGIQALGLANERRIIETVRTFDDFSPESDPWGEHDFGMFKHDGETIYWKIDCYDLTKTAGSPNPANAGVTHRVLTIMLSSEY